jgi:hypothetical protein
MSSLPDELLMRHRGPSLNSSADNKLKNNPGSVKCEFLQDAISYQEEQKEESVCLLK